MKSIEEILQRIKDGLEVSLCDILSFQCFDQKDREMRQAALIAWTTNNFNTP